ncbi:WxL domain-containing protein [Brochothrix campestris]|uniref:WxL domain cell surface protein n=1 Tax=Brochothrix campestris FSL F6-1037 TaxID=1265861 RepID=W7CUN0_9LIST|nr:WxL domain-containing protein [Brochothrix campestris]EUJ39556.1 WxL domain cell surface protein [Brochothrix campestris FSL F6-1037]
MTNLQMFGKRIAITTLITAVVTGTIMTAEAAETQDYQSNAVVNFIQSTDPTLPVDPENPDPGTPVDPIDPTDPEGPNPGTPGPLSIDFASSLQFGTTKITTKDAVYNAYAQAITVAGEQQYRPNYVQITDNRGTEVGWTLTVTQAKQLTSTAGKQLQGAVITLEQSEVKTITGSELAAPSQVAKTVVLQPEEAVPVMAANEGEGAGLWTAHFGNSEKTLQEGSDLVPGEGGAEPSEIKVMRNTAVTLSVPGKSLKTEAEYRSQLNWTLAEVPTNGADI